MTSLQRVQAVLAGKLPDCVPVCLHNFLLAAREAGVPLEKSLEDPDAAARIHLHAVEGIFTVIHVCGDTSSILDDLAEYPACGFELDYQTDAARAKRTAGQQHVLFGNIDPSGVVARGTVAEVIEKTRELVKLWKPGGRFILNAGGAIPATTPAANIHALIAVAKDAGRYD